MAEQKGDRFTRYFPVLLDALRSSDPTPMRPADARAWIQSHTPVAEADLSRRIANGVQTIFENDVHWVRFYLAKAGLTSSPKRGLWGLNPTDSGAQTRGLRLPRSRRQAGRGRDRPRLRGADPRSAQHAGSACRCAGDEIVCSTDDYFPMLDALEQCQARVTIRGCGRRTSSGRGCRRG